MNLTIPLYLVFGRRHTAGPGLPLNLRAAVVACLQADTTLTSLIGGAAKISGDQDARFPALPWIVVSDMPATSEHETAGSDGIGHRVMKGVISLLIAAQGSTAAKAIRHQASLVLDPPNPNTPADLTNLDCEVLRVDPTRDEQPVFHGVAPGVPFCSQAIALFEYEADRSY